MCVCVLGEGGGGGRGAYEACQALTAQMGSSCTAQAAAVMLG